MRSMVQLPVANASKEEIEYEKINMAPKVTSSKPLSTTSSNVLPHRPVTHDTAVQRTDLPTISHQVTTNKLATHTKHISVKMSISKNVSSITEKNRPEIFQQFQVRS